MIDIKIHSDTGKYPVYKSDKAACVDLKADLNRNKYPEGTIVLHEDSYIDIIRLMPFQRILVHTGIFIELQEGYKASVKPRSGLALDHGITVLNTPGTVDEDYTGEICVILINLSNKPFEIQDGDRIAQLEIEKYEQVNWIPSDKRDFKVTARGDKGFGSSGTK